MKKQIAMKWVKALRSGKYKQGSGSLYDVVDDTYCCLGVLRAIGEAPNSRSGEAYLSRQYARACGMRGDTEHVSLSQVGLADLNDEYEQTFEEIADFIEVWWEEL